MRTVFPGSFFLNVNLNQHKKQANCCSKFVRGTRCQTLVNESWQSGVAVLLPFGNHLDQLYSSRWIRCDYLQIIC